MHDLVVLGESPSAVGLARSTAALGQRVGLVVAPEWSSGRLVLRDLAREVLRDSIRGLPGATTRPLSRGYAALRAELFRRQRLLAASVPTNGPIEVLSGTARFTGFDSIEIAGRILKSRRFVIAAAANPEPLPQPGLAPSSRVLDSQSFWTTDRAPASLLIVGGPEAWEYAQALARLGTIITLLQPNPPQSRCAADPILKPLAATLEVQGVRLLRGSKLISAEPRGSRLLFRLRSDDPADAAEVEAEAILVVGPFRPRFDDLNLHLLDLTSPAQPGLPVDRSLHLCAGRIWAIGEAVQPGLSAEASALHAQRLLESWNRRHSHPSTIYSLNPQVIGTDPAIVVIGTEADRHSSGRRLAIPISPSAARGVPGRLELQLDARGRIHAASACDREANRLLTLLQQACENRWSVARLASQSTLDPRLDDALASLAAADHHQRNPKRRLARLIRSLAGYLPEDPPATPAPGPHVANAATRRLHASRHP